MEETAYSKDKPLLPISLNLNNSKAKVEKVENPPQKPTIIKYLSAGKSANFPTNNPAIKPKVREAKIFVRKVAVGNPEPSQGKARLMAYRHALPKAPPMATNKSLSIFIPPFTDIVDHLHDAKYDKEIYKSTYTCS